MDFVNVLVLPLVLSLMFILPGSFLCLYTVREHLRFKWYVIVPVLFVNVIVYYLFRRISWLGIIPFMLYAFLVYRWLADVQPAKLLFIQMVVVTYLLFTNSIFFMFEGSAYTWSWDDLDLIFLGFALTFPVMLWFLRKHVWPPLRSMDVTGIRWLWSIPSTFMALNLILCSSYIQSLLNVSLAWPYVFITSLFALATAGVSFLVLDMLKKTQDVSRIEEDMRMVDAQLAMQGRRFTELIGHVDEIRVLKHDMRHHNRVLLGMLEEKQYDKAVAYLQEYINDASQMGALPVCSNYIADLIVRQGQMLAAERDIEMAAQVSIPAECWVRDVDLCIILGNIMENALRACDAQRKGHRYINLRIRTTEDELLITIENSRDNEPSTEESTLPLDLPRSSGLGIPSITAVAEKYGGTARFQPEDGAFRASVLLFRRQLPA